MLLITSLALLSTGLTYNIWNNSSFDNWHDKIIHTADYNSPSEYVEIEVGYESFEDVITAFGQVQPPILSHNLLDINLTGKDSSQSESSATLTYYHFPQLLLQRDSTGWEVRKFALASNYASNVVYTCSIAYNNVQIGSFNNLDYVTSDLEFHVPYEEDEDLPLSFRIRFSLTNTFDLSDTGYNDAYATGYNGGFDDGYSDGYNTGFTDGKNSVNVTELQNTAFEHGVQVGMAQVTADYGFMSLFASIADTPILMIRKLFDFSIFGTSMLALVLSLLTAIILIHVIKKVIK